MTKTLLTLIVLGVIGCFLFSSSNAQIAYTRSTTLYGIADSTSATSTGRTLFITVGTMNTISGVSAKRNLIYKITIDTLSTANKVSLYDAKSYSDATLNNRIIGEVEYVASTTVFRGINGENYQGYANQALAGVAGAGGRGVAILGCVPITFDFTQKDGKPLYLDYGLHIDGTDGANPYTVTVIYMRE